MKKLNITKEQFEKSRYFKNKYGKLEYVSESGKVFKTDKGKLLKFKESTGIEDIEDELWDKWERMSDEITSALNIEQVAKSVARKYFPRKANEIANWINENIELICTDGYYEDWTDLNSCLDIFIGDTDIQLSDLA